MKKLDSAETAYILYILSKHLRILRDSKSLSFATKKQMQRELRESIFTLTGDSNYETQ